MPTGRGISMSSGVNKKLVLILNKMDLVPREMVDQWLKYIRNEFPTVAFKASTQSQKHNLIINSLKRCRACTVGSTPGVTKESEEEEEESGEDESGEEAMEGSDGETQKDDTAKSVTQSWEKADSGLNADEINEFNLQSNKDRKKIFKKQQKERRKKAESSAEAMDDSDDDYNFDTDFS